MARPRSALTTFILSLPHTVSVTEVIAQAKAKGMMATESNIYRVRRLPKAKSTGTAPAKTTAPAAVKTVAAKPPSKTSTSKPVAPSKAAAPARRPQLKSDFIRKQPATLSAAEVVAKGKAEGLKFTDSLVYMVRGPKAKKDAAKKAAAKPVVAAKSKAPKTRIAAKTSGAAPTSKPTPTSSPKTAGPSKSEFIRRQPASVSAKDIVASAKAAGITIHVNQVYKVRGSRKTTQTTKTAATQAPTRRATVARNGVSVPRPVTGSSSVEDLLRAVAAELGLGRAVEILAGERARVRAVIGG